MRNFGYSEKGDTASIRDYHLWQRIIGYCSRHKVGLFGAVILSFAVTSASLSLPKLMQYGIDSYITVETIDPETRISGLGNVTAMYGLMVVTVFICSFLQVILLEWVGQSIMHRLRMDLFNKLIYLDLAFFNQERVGRLVTRLTNDIQNMHEMFTSVMVTLFNDLLKLVGIFVILYLMNVDLALVMSGFVPLAVVITYFFSKFAREKFRAIRNQLAKMNTFLSESIGSMNVIQVFGRQEKLDNDYMEMTSEYLKRTFAQIRVFGSFMPLTELMGSVAVALILWYGGGEVIQQRLSIGELVAFISYMRLFFQPLRELSQKYSIVQSAMASAERIFQLLDKESRLQVQEPVTTMDEVKGDISFERVWFEYENDTPVLQSITLNIKAGETIALVGSTGSGKSTLINLLVRFYDPVKGHITIDGQDISHIPIHRLRQVVGVVLQDILLLPDTVAANIILDQEMDQEKIDHIIKQTGVGAFIDRLPKGLNTIIGEGGTSLSVGEKQLLSFARALYRDPAILILDEATASIDTHSENILQQAVEAGFKGRTSLVIAHRLSTVRSVDRIVVMDKGQVVEEGSHEDLMQQNSRYRTLVQLDLKNDG